MYGKKKSKLGKILLWALIALLVLGVIAAIVSFADGTSGNLDDILGGIINKPSSNSVSVKYNGEVLKNGDKVDLPESGQARFEVANGGNYTVQVFPNVTETTDFDFTVGGVSRSYLAQGDFGEWFVSPNNKTENGFIVSCSYEFFTVDGLLGYIYGSDIGVETDIEYPFKLVITSSGGSSVTVNLRQDNSEKSIVFDTEGDIVF